MAGLLARHRVVDTAPARNHGKTAWCVAGTIAVMAVAGCGSSSGGGTPTPGGATSAPASQSSSAAATATSQATAVATSLDPCQLVSSSTASQLAGTSFGSGHPETTSGNAQLCFYNSASPPADFLVEVAQAPDAATAQSEWATQEQKVEQDLNQQVGSNGVSLTFTATDVSIAGADKAALISGSASYAGHTFSATDVFTLKGAIFFFMSDLSLGGTPASASSMEQAAQSVMGQLP